MSREKIKILLVCIIVAFVLVALIYVNNGGDKLIFSGNYDHFIELHYNDFTYDHGYAIKGTYFYADEERPWLGIIDEGKMQVASSKIIFNDSLKEDTVIQVYYSEGELNEEQSRVKTAPRGTKEIIINFPRGKYRELRFDIRGDFGLSSVQLSNNVALSLENKVECFNIIFLILLTACIIYIIYKNHIKIEKLLSLVLEHFMIFEIVLAIWGIFFAFLLIPWQAPDEHQHLVLIGEGINNSYLAEALFADMPLDMERIMFHAEEKIDSRQIIMAMEKKPQYNALSCMPRGVNKQLLGHFPATLGILLGVILKMPTYWTIMLGRLFSLVFYITICSISLKMVPFKKEVFKICMLLPMCIQQAASLSYDAVLIPMSFLFVAYILYLKYSILEIKIQQIVISLGIWICISAIKLPYIFLGGIYLIVPFQKMTFGKHNLINKLYRYRYIIGLLAALICGILIYISEYNSWVKLAYSSICEFPQTLYLFKITWENFASHLFVSLVGNFGYLDTPTATWFVGIMIAYITAIAITSISDNIRGGIVRYDIDNIYVLSGRDRVIMYMTFLVCSYFIVLSMVPHTAKILFYGTESVDVIFNWREILYQIPYIGGWQGRYFIPIILLFLLPMPKVFEMKRNIYRIVNCIMYLIIVIYTCNIMYLRFWQ